MYNLQTGNPHFKDRERQGEREREGERDEERERGSERESEGERDREGHHDSHVPIIVFLQQPAVGEAPSACRAKAHNF